MLYLSLRHHNLQIVVPFISFYSSHSFKQRSLIFEINGLKQIKQKRFFKNSIFIVLPGLRMSHFREDHDGLLVDPTQKTLSSFFGPGEARKVKTDDNVSFGSNVDASLLATNKETALPLDNHELCCDLMDYQSDSNPMLDHSSRTSSKIFVEMEDNDKIASNVREVKVRKMHIIPKIDQVCFQTYKHELNIEKHFKILHIIRILFYSPTLFVILFLLDIFAVWNYMNQTACSTLVLSNFPIHNRFL